MKRLQHPKRLYLFLWYSTAFLVIALAVLVSSARLLVPSLEGYRSLVEATASRALGQPVTIGGMDAGISGFSPTFIFKDVSLLDAPAGEPVVHAASLRVQLDLFETVRRRQAVLSQLQITGADLSLERTKNGEFHIVGLHRQQTQGPSQVDSWLLALPHAAIKDSHLIWRDAVNGSEHQFDHIDAVLQNDGDQHRLDAVVAPPESFARRLHVALDSHGDPRVPSGWTGTLYLKLEAVHPATWLAGRTLQGLSIRQGSVDAELWSDWKAGALQGSEGQFQLTGIDLKRDSDRFRLERIAGELRWQRLASGWQLRVANLAVRRDGRDWHPGGLEVARDGEQIRLRAAFLRTKDVMAALPLTGLLGDEQRKMLAGLAPTGDLTQLDVTLGPDGSQGQAAFEDLAIKPWHKLPGISGLDGKVIWQGHTATIRLNTDSGQLTLVPLFRAPLRFDRLDGELRLTEAAGAWQVQGNRLRFANPDLHGEVGLDVQVPISGGSPWIDLRGRFADGRATAVPDYLPVGIMPKSTIDWLDHAFVAGRVREGSVLLHGRAADFPFLHHEGQFKVQLSVDGVELNYHPEWPHLHDIAADVEFEGAEMRISAQRAAYLDGKVSKAEVRIADLHNARLAVDASGDFPSKDVLRLFRETPMSEHFGRALRGLSASGMAGVTLHLELPLASQDQPPLVARGELAVAKTRLRIGSRLQIDNIHGTVHFDGADVNGAPLRAQMFGQPLEVAVYTRNGNTVLTANGSATDAALRDGLPVPSLDALSGHTSWFASLKIPHAENGEAELRVSSSLQGMAVYLPPPLAKTADTSRELLLIYRLAGPRAGVVDLYYGEALRSVFAISDEGGLDRGAFHFGTRLPSLPDVRELRITGNLTGFEPAAWGALAPPPAAGSSGADAGPPLPIVLDLHRLQIVQAKSATGGKPRQPLDLPPLDISIEDLELDDQHLGHLRLKAVPAGPVTRFPLLSLKGQHFTVSGKGEWRHDTGVDDSHVSLTLNGDDIGDMMDELGFENVITDGKVRARADLTWPGGPASFSLATVKGPLHVKISDGRIDDLDPGGGRVLGLFSLRALPQRLMLDFSDLFKKGLAFNRIEGDLRLENGQALTEDLKMDAPSSQVTMAGRTGLVSEDYDLLVTVVPNVSESVAVAGGIWMGPQVGAALWLLQKLFHVDEASSFQYMVDGPWSDPVITRLPRPKNGTRGQS